MGAWESGSVGAWERGGVGAWGRGSVGAWERGGGSGKALSGTPQPGLHSVSSPALIAEAPFPQWAEETWDQAGRQGQLRFMNGNPRSTWKDASLPLCYWLTPWGQLEHRTWHRSSMESLPKTSKAVFFLNEQLTLSCSRAPYWGFRSKCANPGQGALSPHNRPLVRVTSGHNVTFPIQMMQKEL